MSDFNSLKHTTTRAKSAFQALLVTSVIRQTCLWLLTLFTVRLLAPTDYGIVGLVMSVYPYLSLLVSMELSEWISQRETLDEGEQKAVFSLSLMLGLLFAGSAYALGPLVAAFYATPELIPLFSWAAVALFLQSIALLPYSLLRRELNFKVLGWANMVAGMVRATLTLGLAFYGFGYWALVIGAIADSIVTTAILVIVRGLPRGFGWNSKLYREALSFAFPATGAVACGIVFSTVDDVVVGKFFGVQVLGYYAMAYHLTDLPLTKINQLLTPILVPYFGKLRSSPDYLHSAFLKVVGVGAALTSPILLGLCMVAPVAIPLVLGEKWEPAVLVVQVMSLAVCFRGLVDKIPSFLLAIDKPGELLRIRGVTALILAPAFIVFANLFDMNGVFFVWLCIYPVTMVYGLFVLRNCTGIAIKRFLKAVKAPLSSALIMGIILSASTAFFGAKVSASLLLTLQTVAGAGIYLLAFFLLFRAELFDLLVICRQLISREPPSVEAAEVS